MMWILKINLEKFIMSLAVRENVFKKISKISLSLVT